MGKEKVNIPNTNNTADKTTNNVRDNATDDNQLIHKFGTINTSILTKKLMVFLIAAVMLGVATGYMFSGGEGSKKSAENGGSIAVEDIEKGAIIGSDDTETFKDTAEGLLKAGGINGEGAFHLERPGGESRNVYLTSSIADLSKFLDRKIKVWGETQQAKVAGWLMDVGRIEVLE